MGLLLSIAGTVACGEAQDSQEPAPVVSPNQGGDPALLDQSTTQTSPDRRFSIQYAPLPDPIPLNDYFELSLEIKGLEGDPPGEDWIVQVDADMPGHNHGMNTQPQVFPLGQGRYRVEGMLFHMPGHWQLFIDVGEREDSLSRTVFHVFLEHGG